MSEVSVKFYDKAVEKAINRSAPNTLGRAGAYLRAIAKNSIKRRKDPNLSSAPGTPPYHHSNFKHTIKFAVSTQEKAVYIGPEIVRGGMENAGRMHEFGGVKRNTAPAVKYNLEMPGPIKGTNRNDAVFIILKTARQVAKAERVAEKIYPWRQNRILRYPARPFMRPALMAGLPKLSKFWNNAITP